jgi:hypothetical protein
MTAALSAPRPGFLSKPIWYLTPSLGMVYILCHEYGAHRITFRELLGRFSVITRTVFENTNCKLKEWFKAISLMFHSKKGLSALRIHWMLGTGSYETAWFMCQRIRAAMHGDMFPIISDAKGTAISIN